MYQCRVTVKQTNELAPSEEETKKGGRPGLRVKDGFQGPALQVARGILVDQLATKECPNLLLRTLQNACQPRVQQEARRLYQVGAQNGGKLSRQNCEPVISYVLRGRTWHDMKVGLDSTCDLGRAPFLSNAGLRQSHHLLIRTALQGDMIAQNPQEGATRQSLGDSTMWKKIR